MSYSQLAVYTVSVKCVHRIRIHVQISVDLCKRVLTSTLCGMNPSSKRPTVLVTMHEFCFPSDENYYSQVIIYTSSIEHTSHHAPVLIYVRTTLAKSCHTFGIKTDRKFILIIHVVISRQPCCASDVTPVI